MTHTTPQPATVAQIREWYRNQNYRTRIGRNGYVTCRLIDAVPGTPWIDCPWASEHLFNNESGVYIAGQPYNYEPIYGGRRA